MSSPDQVRTVAVSVRLPEGLDLTEASRLRVRIEDSSIADRAPEVIGRAEQPVGGTARGSEVRLEVEVPTGLVDQRSSYTVFLHLDVAGNGEVEAGDALTTQVLPVLTQGAPDEVRADLQRIG